MNTLNYDGDSFDNGVPVNDGVGSVWTRTGQYINFYRDSGANIFGGCAGAVDARPCEQPCGRHNH